ncbi:MAG: non-canonical purine NTP pyrophosphatase [Polyangiaceae bacterium]
MMRPALQEPFFTAQKQLEVFFYTSNVDKFLQARWVFERCGLVLRHFRSRRDPYDEDYSADSKSLLRRAVQDVVRRIGGGSVFFIEDTSVRIDALSSVNEDFPGLQVKDWFARTTFEELDAALRQVGNRSATVRSDIALHLPGLSEPVFFHGETRGSIPLAPPVFQPSRQYPWLTPETFNGWFVPDGYSHCLGEMSLEESWSVDFRVRSLVALIGRILEYTVALNLPSTAYRYAKPRAETDQLALFSEAFPLVVVVGPTCAGKTTLGEHLSHRHGHYFIEASSVVRMFRNETSGAQGMSAFEFAQRLLSEKGADVVARQVVRLLRAGHHSKVVISGFRTIEELEVIRREFPETRTVLVEASERTRYERNLRRARTGAPQGFEDFVRTDREQWQFGLLRVARELASVRIENEQSLDGFYDQIDAVMAGATSEVKGVATNLSPRVEEKRNQLHRCLSALEHASRPLTCDEIAALAPAGRRPLRPNNVNKILKGAPELARRLDDGQNKIRYEILPAGRAYLRFLYKSDAASGDAHAVGEDETSREG